MDHCDKHKILKDNQHGFRKRRSCDTQLIVTVQEIALRLAKGKQVDVILLDFEKAFLTRYPIGDRSTRVGNE